MSLPPIWDPSKSITDNNRAMHDHKQMQSFWDDLSAPPKPPNRRGNTSSSDGSGSKVLGAIGIVLALGFIGKMADGPSGTERVDKQTAATQAPGKLGKGAKKEASPVQLPHVAPAPVFRSFAERTITIPYGEKQTYEEALQRLFTSAIRNSESTMFGADLNNATEQLANEAGSGTRNNLQFRGGFIDRVNGDAMHVSLAPLNQRVSNGVMCIDSPYGVRSLNRFSMVPGAQDGLKVTFSSTLTGASGSAVDLKELESWPR